MTIHAFTLVASREGQVIPGFSFAEPASISLQYSDQDLRGSGDESGLRFLLWQDGAWQDPQEDCGATDRYPQDMGNNRISAAICRSGRYALFAPAYTVLFPVVP